MFTSRVLGRVLFSAVKSESSTAAAAAGSTAVRTARNPLEEFFELDRSTEEEKPIVYGNTFLILSLDFLEKISTLVHCQLL